MNNGKLLVQVDQLVKHFPIMKGVLRRPAGLVHAVDGISFGIRQAETFGLVGESGCGKSTTGRTIVQLYRPTAGHIFLDGVDLGALHGEALRRVRRRMQMIFQDPYASLNPRMKVRDIVGEPLRVHQIAGRAEIKERVNELLDIVQLNPAMGDRYPHEFSGGQRQRIGIARALAVHPDFIVCDEPISALDVSIQAQVINLLEDLQDKFHLAYLFISHDLSVVRHISNRVAVMYLGVLVELADQTELYAHPLHPYTKALLSAAPVPDPAYDKDRQEIVLEGDVPSPIHPPSGCRFRTRCPIAEAICAKTTPLWSEAAPNHWVACLKV
jgi:oligopeptide transport system ATP-binding protein